MAMGWFSKAPKKQEAPKQVGVEFVSSSRPLAPRRGSDQILLSYKDIPIIRGVVSRIAQSVASTEWKIGRTTSQGAKSTARKIKRADYDNRKDVIASVQKSGDFEWFDDHPALSILHSSNGLLSGGDVIELVQTFLDLKGEALLMVQYDAMGIPAALWPVPPHWIMDIPHSGQPSFKIKGSSGEQILDPAQAIWIKVPDPANPYGRGIGLVEALATEIDSDENAAEYIKAFFMNDATPGGVISLEGAQPDQVDAFRVRWENSNRGASKSHKMHFTNTETKFTATSGAFKDQAVVDLRKFLRDMSLNTFGVPPEILGIVENSNRATIDAATYIFARWVLVPRLEKIRAALQSQLIDKFDKTLILDYESPVPSDQEFTLKAATAAPYTRTRAEWRTLQGLEPNDGDNVYIEPMGVTTKPVEQSEQIEEEDPSDEAEESEKSLAVPSIAMVKGLDAIGQRLILESLRPERLSSSSMDVLSEGIEEWAAMFSEQYGLNVSFNMLNPRVVGHIREFGGDRVKLINDSTKDQLRDVLEEGVRLGSSAEQLAAQIAANFDEYANDRAEKIARTEANRARNFATDETMRQSGVVFAREWVSVPYDDDRVRDEHLALDGDVKDQGSPFVINEGQYKGATAMFPGDFGIAAMDINCRCTVVAALPDRKRSTDERVAIWKDYDKKAEKFDEKLTKAFREGFRDQLVDVLEAVKLAYRV